jgi:ferritin-like metal-binding protein YciE
VRKFSPMKRPHNRDVGFLLRAYTRQIQELYDFEKQFLALLSRFSAVELPKDVDTIFVELASQTGGHVNHLEQIMKRLAVHSRTAHSRHTSHLITSLKRFVKEPRKFHDARHEAAMLTSLHKVESFEVACYATTHSYARLLSFHDDLAPLERAYNDGRIMEERLENLIRQLERALPKAELEMSI